MNTQTTKELLTRLRDVGEGHPLGALCHSAADELEKQDIQKAVLTREIERLRGGIRVALEHHKWGRYREMAEYLELLP